MGSKRRKIVFGLDGGIGARASASILRNQDYDLIAVHLYCDLAGRGEDPSTYPSAMGPSDLPEIERFAESLGIPFRAIDVTEEVLGKVYDPFFVSTLSARPFSGSIAWNREILFPKLTEIADSRGSASIATGHFAGRSATLTRYPVPEFDQSLSLSRIGRKALDRLELPVGEVTIEMLLRLAREIGAIPKSEGPSSPEAENEILRRERRSRGTWEWTEEQLSNPALQARAAGDPFQGGPVSGSDEFAIGEHRGLPFFRIGSPAPLHAGHFVLSIRPQSRGLVIGPESSLAADRLFVKELDWIGDRPKKPFRERRVRAEKEPPNRLVPPLGPSGSPATLVEFPGGLAEIRLDRPLYSVSPGETVLLLEEEEVLGSAIVSETVPARSVEKTDPTS